MKQKFIISIVLIGFMVALSGNSWAQRERGGDRRPDQSGRVEKFSGSENPDFDRNSVHKRDRGNQTRRDFNRPGPGSNHKLQKRPAYGSQHPFQRRHPWGVPNRFKPKHRHWRHLPANRRPHPKPFFKRYRHSVLNQVNNYYSNAESYSEPEDEFTASALVSDTGFSVSVGVRETN